VAISQSLLSFNSAARGPDGCTQEVTGCGGGGAISLTGDAKLTLTGNTRCVGNSASGDSGESSGGAILAWGSASIVLHNSSLVDNFSQDADGGAISLLQDSTLELSGSTFASNRATSRAGAIFIGPGYSFGSSSVAVTMLDSNYLVSNMAISDGGAIFSYRAIAFFFGGFSKFQENVATQGQGGGIAILSSKLQIENGHRLELSRNEAISGGGVALLSGSSVSLTKEVCSESCDQTRKIGNGYCDTECLNRACRWDGGDCLPRLKSAGIDAAQTCNRKSCTIFGQMAKIATANGCSDNCFTASCDWSKMLCSEPREAIRECPLLDGVAYRSIKQQQNVSASPIFMVNGNSGNFGRCDVDGCQQPSVAPSASSFLDTNSKIGPAALHLIGQSTGFLLADLGDRKMGGLTSGFTVEAWVKIDDTSSWKDGSLAFLVAGLNFAVGVLKDGSIMSPLVFQTGPMPLDSCWLERVLVASSGVISDGPLNEARNPSEGNETCVWIIAPTGASTVTLIFTEMSLRISNVLIISACHDPQCSTRTSLNSWPVAGQTHMMPPQITSETGVMRVAYRTDHGMIKTAPGFTASYSASNSSVHFTSSVWNHLAVSQSVDGLNQIFINGTLSQSGYLDWNLNVARPFENGGSIGR